MPSAPEMQHADQREQTARRIGVDLCLALKALFQNARALVVNATAGHVDGLDLAWRHVFDGVKIAFADRPVILDHLSERAQRKVKLCGQFLGLAKSPGGNVAMVTWNTLYMQWLL